MLGTFLRRAGIDATVYEVQPGEPGDLLFGPMSTTKLELVGTTPLRSGVVLLTYLPLRTT